MGSNETAITIPGGPRVIDVFTGDGAIGPKDLLFSQADRRPDSLWDRSGTGWSPRPHAAALGARQGALDPKLWGLALDKHLASYVSFDASACACAVGDCTRQTQTPSDPMETSGPRIDRFRLVRPPWTMAASSPRIKKILFSAPRKCPIDLFGPVANRTLAKHVRSRVGTSRSARC